jgi:UDP-glucose 4-epimerase
MMHTPDRVVLLGGRGFIGGELARQLQVQRIPMLCVTSQQVDLAAADSISMLANLLRPTDVVIMLAAITPDKGRDSATLLRNIAMMHSVCTALAQTGCAQLLYFSSDAVYNSAVDHVTQDTPAAPEDLYGAMHLARERMACSVGKWPVLILRPTLVYGLRDSHNAYGPNRFFREAKETGRISLFGQGEEMRDHIAVEDVAGLALLGMHKQSSGIFNLVTGVSTSFSALATMVATQISGAIEIRHTPRVNPITHRHYENTRLFQAFPEFRCVTLVDGIARMRQSLNQETHG